MRCRQDTRGSVGIWFAVAMSCAATLGMGCYHLMDRWAKETQTQVKLDRCTGMYALNLKHNWMDLEKLNEKMIRIRTTIKGLLATAAIEPANIELIEILRKQLVALVIQQEAVHANWILNQAGWFARKGCKNFGWLSYLKGGRYPAFPYQRSPSSDFIGLRPLQWIESEEKIFHLWLQEGVRKSIVEIGVSYAKWVAKTGTNTI